MDAAQENFRQLNATRLPRPVILVGDNDLADLPFRDALTELRRTRSDPDQISVLDSQIDDRRHQEEARA